jgi:hypothetical protein
MFPDSTLRSAGTDSSGLLKVSGATEGVLAGHGDETSNAGHISGVFGTCNGRCTFED